MRAGSQRLPNKNIRNFFGKPIFYYTLEYAKKTNIFDEIIVSTESKEVVKLCEEFNLKIPFLRPEQLSKDDVPLVDVCLHVIEEYEKQGKYFNNLCLLWATAPMRTDKDIINAYSMLKGDIEAVVGVTDYDFSIYSAFNIDKNYNLKSLFPNYLRLKSQKQPKVVCVNSTLCWLKVTTLKRERTWLPSKSKGYWMPRKYSTDIDTIDDWELAEFYYQNHSLTLTKND